MYITAFINGLLSDIIRKIQYHIKFYAKIII